MEETEARLRRRIRASRLDLPGDMALTGPSMRQLFGAILVGGMLLASACGEDPTFPEVGPAVGVQAPSGEASALMSGDSVWWDDNVLEVEDDGTTYKIVRSGPTDEWDEFLFYEDDVYQGRMNITWSSGEAVAVRAYDVNHEWIHVEDPTASDPIATEGSFSLDPCGEWDDLYAEWDPADPPPPPPPQECAGFTDPCQDEKDEFWHHFKAFAGWGIISGALIVKQVYPVAAYTVVNATYHAGRSLWSVWEIWACSPPPPPPQS